MRKNWNARLLAILGICVAVGATAGMKSSAVSPNQRTNETKATLSTEEFPLDEANLQFSGNPSVRYSEWVNRMPSFDLDRRLSEAVQRCSQEIQKGVAGLQVLSLTILKKSPCAVVSDQAGGSQTNLQVTGEVQYLPLPAKEK